MIDIAASILSVALLLWAAAFVSLNDIYARLLALALFVTVVYMASRLSFIGWQGMAP